MVRCFLNLCLLVAGVLAASVGAEEVVHVASRGDKNAEYALKMLDLALQKSGGQYRIDIKQEALTSARLREDLIEGDLDVIWAATDTDMETHALPVRIPLYKGLLGYRVLIVHKDNTRLFAGVDSFQDLKQFSFGQGRGWPDTAILGANGLEVVQASKYEGLFYMTDGKRFDAYPRGVHEPWAEIASRPDLELTVDSNVLLVYRMPFYLFVTPKRPDLAEAVYRGLRQAVTDGSFDKVFYADETVRMVMSKAQIKGRKVFELTNPDLPPKTPLDQPELWLDVSQL